MRKEIFVPIPKFDAMAAVISCSNIVEGKNCKLVPVFGKSYVISSAIGNGTGVGRWAELGGYEVTPEPLYRGDLVALDYGRQISAILNDERPRSYNGLKIKVDGKLRHCRRATFRRHGRQCGVIRKKILCSIQKNSGCTFPHIVGGLGFLCEMRRKNLVFLPQHFLV